MHSGRASPLAPPLPRFPAGAAVPLPARQVRGCIFPASPCTAELSPAALAHIWLQDPGVWGDGNAAFWVVAASCHGTTAGQIEVSSCRPFHLSCCLAHGFAGRDLADPRGFHSPVQVDDRALRVSAQPRGIIHPFAPTRQSTVCCSMEPSWFVWADSLPASNWGVAGSLMLSLKQ